jgi:hypothetical protein
MTNTYNKMILTGDQVEIVPLSQDELANLQNLIEENNASKAVEAKAQADKAAAKAKLEALGLTLDDLAALGL